jgi:hypothetical protein
MGIKMNNLPNINKVVKKAVIARSGIYPYQARELVMFGLNPEDAPIKKDIYNVYRPSLVLAENKDKFSMMALTNEHPQGFLTNDNWKNYLVGYTGDSVNLDWNKDIDEVVISTPVAVIDSDAIDDLTAGKKEVSCGYYGIFKFENGTSPNGEPYDIIMSGVRDNANHLALCQKARGGETIRIMDGGKMNVINYVSGLYRTARKFIAGVMDADLGKFREIINQIVTSRATLSDEELQKDIDSLINYTNDLPDSDEKNKLTRFIEDFPKGIKEKDDALAQKAGELITSLFEKLDTESMEVEAKGGNMPENNTNVQPPVVPKTDALPENVVGQTPTTPPVNTNKPAVTDDPTAGLTPEQKSYYDQECQALLNRIKTTDCWKAKDAELEEKKEEIEKPKDEGAKDSMNMSIIDNKTNEIDPFEKWFNSKKGGKK